MSSQPILSPSEELAADALEAARRWGLKVDGTYGPGAMEENPWWAAYFQELAMDGCCEDVPFGPWQPILLTPMECRIFDLLGKDYVLVGQDSNGFIHVKTVTIDELLTMREEHGDVVPF